MRAPLSTPYEHLRRRRERRDGNEAHAQSHADIPAALDLTGFPACRRVRSSNAPR